VQDNVNMEDSDHNLDLIMIIKLFKNLNLVKINILLKDLILQLFKRQINLLQSGDQLVL